MIPTRIAKQSVILLWPIFPGLVQCPQLPSNKSASEQNCHKLCLVFFFSGHFRGEDMLLESNFESRSTFKRKWKLSEPLALKYEQKSRKENVCFALLCRQVIGFVGHVKCI